MTNQYVNFYLHFVGEFSEIVIQYVSPPYTPKSREVKFIKKSRYVSSEVKFEIGTG